MASSASSLTFSVCGALSAAIAAGLSAVAAHLPGVAAVNAQSLHSAIHMQQWHAVGLILLGALLYVVGPSKLLLAAGACFIAGTVMFSGGIYLRVLGNIAWLRPMVPYGGGAFIVGWFLLAMGLFFSSMNPVLSGVEKSTNPRP